MDIERLIEEIKLNCNISDAKYWGFFSICGLLMRLRELYRSEHGLMPWESIPREEISRWIEERERLWQSLEDSSLTPLRIEDDIFEPFSVEEINERINPHGLVYGGGYGRFNKPSFFLARLLRSEDIYDYHVYHTGEELCRDLLAPSAMLQGRCIFIREEQIKALLWEKLQELRNKRYEVTTGLSLKNYYEGIESTEGLIRSIDRLAEQVSRILLYHEIGEAYEDESSEEWLRIIMENKDRSCDFYLRGIKDVLADTSEKGSLKYIIDNNLREHLNIYYLLLDPTRKDLMPEFVESYKEFLRSGDWSVIDKARQLSYNKYMEIKREIVREGKIITLKGLQR